MTLSRPSPGVLGFHDVPAPLADIIRKVPRLNEALSQKAEARFFPEPADDEQLSRDWKAHVQPGLQELFMDARATVAADLKAMKQDGENCSLDFPERHIPAWINALNQARLALAETHGFTEKELASRRPPPLDSPRDFARLEIDFLAAIQDWLVSILEEE